MTGDTGLTHIRDALPHVHRDVRDDGSTVYLRVDKPALTVGMIASAERQLSAAEAVIQAARDVADKSPALMSDTPFAHALNNLHKHFAALEDGQ